MEVKFNAILERIAKLAENLGGRAHLRITKIWMYLCFIAAILFFGFFIFSLSFFQSLLGTHRKD